jgi:glutaredoxin
VIAGDNSKKRKETTMQSGATIETKERPAISVFWIPGCSSCLKTKEFVEEQGVPFESVNVSENQEAMDELAAAGLRGLPVVRRGDKYVYAQFIDNVAELLEVSRNRRRLSKDELLERWEKVLERGRDIIAGFDEQILERRAMADRDRSIKVLSSHVFQINEAFRKMIDEGMVDTRTIGDDPRADIVTRNDLLSYIDKMLEQYRAWRAAGRSNLIPERVRTFYGEHPSQPVLERYVWHSAQHTRQLDHVAAGLGAELRMPPELYSDLPLPKRLWA